VLTGLTEYSMLNSEEVADGVVVSVITMADPASCPARGEFSTRVKSNARAADVETACDQIGEDATDDSTVLGVAVSKGDRIFVPSVVITITKTRQSSAKWTPSLINTATSRPDRSRDKSSAIAVSVAAMKRRDTADFDVDRHLTEVPTGSATSTCPRVETLASSTAIHGRSQPSRQIMRSRQSSTVASNGIVALLCEGLTDRSNGSEL
jgi:hypothetical protein